MAGHLTSQPSYSTPYRDNSDVDELIPTEAESSKTARRNSESYYPPAPSASNIASRETEYDLDSDDLEDGIHSPTEPLMQGLIQSSKRRNIDSGQQKEEDDSGLPDFLTRGGGLLSSISNMSNSILGAGIIGLPYALREAGLVTGILLLVILGAVTDWTIRLIVINSKMSGRNTYIDIMDACFGFRGRAIVSFFQFVFAFGGMCAFGVVLGDTIPHVLAWLLPDDPGSFVSFLISRRFVVVVLTLGISYPLSLYRDIEKLSKASALALVSMLIIVFTVGIRGPALDRSLQGDPEERWTFIQPGVFESIGVISFAFVCHHNSLLIYGSLKTPTLDRFARVTHISTGLSVIACLCMSLSGFFVFTNKTQGNILNNFPQNDALVNIARACFGANMFATLPLEVFVCREVMETFFWPDQLFNYTRHVIITTCVVFSALFISLTTCDLGFVLEIAGGFSATALAYLFPAACYLRLSTESAQTRNSRLAAKVCAAFGLVVMVLATSLSITRNLNGTKGAKECN